MKRNLIRISALFAWISALLLASGCGEDFEYEKDYSVYDGVNLKIHMTDENNVLNLNLINSTYRVRVDVMPNHVRINAQEYLYTIEDETIATVDETGLISMKSDGETKLTVKLAVRPQITASCTLHVKPVVANRLNVPEQVSVKEGSTLNLAEKIFVTPASAAAPLEYHIADQTIATISDDGIITALKGGSTTITVSTTDGSNLSETIELAVEGKKYITEILLPEEEFSGVVLLVGEEINIGEQTRILPEDAEDPSIRFSVASGQDVISVSEDGVVQCLQAGEAVIRAEALDGSQVQSEMTITVYNGTYSWADRTGWTVTTSLVENGLNYIPDGGTNGKPELILDGSSSTFLSIRKPEYYDYHDLDSPNKEIYFVVDTGEPTSFNMIRYEHRHLNNLLSADKIEVSGSNDGSQFTVIKSDIAVPFKAGSQTVYAYEVRLPSSSWRYIKVKATAWTPYTGSTGSCVQIAEFNVGMLQ